MKDYSKVMLATPIRGNQVVTLYAAGLLQSNGLHGGWLPMAGQSDIYVARNVLANTFMENPAFDTLVMIDSDIGFTRDDLKNLIDSQEDVVSGLYTDKCQPPKPFCRDEHGNDVLPADIPPQGMLKAKFVPGGFLKVERHVFQAIIDQKIVPAYGEGKLHHFYNGRIEMDCLLSEDYGFCTIVRQAGFQPWINCGVRLNHDGRIFVE